MVLVTGCAQKVVPTEGPQVSMMVEINVTSSEYDLVPLLWNVTQNTLQSSGTSVLHANNTNSEAKLCWRTGSPLLAVQHWSQKDELPLMTAMSKELNVLVPPVGMQYASATSGFLTRWYAPEENAFVTVLSELRVSSSQKTLDGTSITITEHSLAPDSTAQTLTVPLPAGLTQMNVLYGSGSMTNGFVLVEAADNVAKSMSDSMWLLRMNDGKAAWVRCGDASAFGGNLISDQDPSFARVGALLYFTHSHTKIGCIDTAAASPTVTLPETINTLLAKLYRGGPTDAEWPLQAHLASDNGTLVMEYPDGNWNTMCYVVNTSGTVLGSLRGDKTSITSFDAKGREGSSLPFKNALNGVSLPSIDLFESPVS